MLHPLIPDVVEHSDQSLDVVDDKVTEWLVMRVSLTRKYQFSFHLMRYNKVKCQVQNVLKRSKNHDQWASCEIKNEDAFDFIFKLVLYEPFQDNACPRICNFDWAVGSGLAPQYRMGRKFNALIWYVSATSPSANSSHMTFRTHFILGNAAVWYSIENSWLH
jgi:hypothetical protein